MMLWMLSIPVFFLVLLSLALYFYWRTLKIPNGSLSEYPRVTVLIPVRNEASGIEVLINDLKLQDYPAEYWELIWVDDHSGDQTRELIRASGIPCRLIELKHQAGKKQAILEGIRQASGEIILTTDGDCRLKPGWIKAMVETYVSQSAVMVSGPVQLYPESSWFGRLQGLEFSSLIGAGAATLQAGYPTMCNGANLMYSRKVFEQINGFAGNEGVASGDDEFLMHKIYKQGAGKVCFCKNPDAIVSTLPASSLKVFVHQRLRWGSKWSAYRLGYIKALALSVFLGNLALVMGAVLGWFWTAGWPWFMAMLVLKALVDYLFLWEVRRFMGRSLSPGNYLALALIHPFYVIYIALRGRFGSFYWKGRSYKING